MAYDVEKKAGEVGAGDFGMSPSGRVPGKRTLAEGLPASAERHGVRRRTSSQRRGDEPFGSRIGAVSGLQDVAANGVRGTGGQLPYAETIQAAFGAHDVSGVRAHVGGQASESCEAIGAEAYATGNDVAFREMPDLHTAAHEAAHVVQQRAGVSLKGGVGEAGDAYEKHADAVADLVVAGKNAEQQLGEMAGSASSGAFLQRKEAPFMPGDDFEERKGDIAALEKACPAGENERDPERCVLSDEDRIEYRRRVGRGLDDARDAFVAACDIVKGTVAERDSFFVSALIGVLSTVAGAMLSRAMGVVVGEVAKGLKKSDLMRQLVGDSRITSTVQGATDGQVGRLGDGVQSGNQGEADEQRGYLDQLKLQARVEFDKVSGLGLVGLDDRKLVGLHDSIKGKTITAEDYVGAIQAKLAAYKSDVQAIGRDEGYPIDAVWIENAGRTRAALCYDTAGRLQFGGGRYVFKSWVHAGLEDAAMARQRDTTRHGLLGTPLKEDTVPAKDVGTEGVVVYGFGTSRSYKSDKESFDEWINEAIPEGQRGTWPTW